MSNWAHQDRGKEAIYKARDEGAKAILAVAPPGAGKSRVMVQMANEEVSRGGKVNIFVHRSMIREQMVRVLKRPESVLEFKRLDSSRTSTRRSRFACWTPCSVDALSVQDRAIGRWGILVSCLSMRRIAKSATKPKLFLLAVRQKRVSGTDIVSSDRQSSGLPERQLIAMRSMIG